MNGDPLFWNKIIGSVLTAGLIAMVSGFVAHLSYHPHIPEKPHFVIGGNEPVQEASADTAPAGPKPIAGLLPTADPDKGARIFKKCHACHTIEKGGANKVGPNLWNVVGGPKAHSDTYSYSSGMKNKGGKWTYADLNHFLYKPRDFVDGTKMTFAGLKKAQDRADVIRFLHDHSDNPVPLPASK